MYSMVLMAALTTGTDMPDWGRRWGCHGCWGGWGGCWGCWGGYGRGGYGWGGCGGWGGYGWGGCGGWGCYGWGGWGGWGYAYAPAYAPVAVTYPAPTALVYNPVPATTPVTTRSMYPDTSAGYRATIIVHLPETATLTVNGKPTTSTSATRHFYSPPLEPGKNYHYTFQARMDRDGKKVNAERRVDVSAGDRREITITMPDLNQPPERPQSTKPDDKKGIRDRRLQVDHR